MDERLILSDMAIGFINDQKAGKSKMVFTIAELEEKPTTITIESPNPYLDRGAMISLLNDHVNAIMTKYKFWRGAVASHEKQRKENEERKQSLLDDE